MLNEEQKRAFLRALEAMTVETENLVLAWGDRSKEIREAAFDDLSFAERANELSMRMASAYWGLNVSAY